MFEEITPIKSHVTREEILNKFNNLRKQTTAAESLQILHLISEFCRYWYDVPKYTKVLSYKVQGDNAQAFFRYNVSEYNSVAYFSFYSRVRNGVTVIVEVDEPEIIKVTLCFRDRSVQIPKVIDLAKAMGIQHCKLIETIVQPVDHIAGVYAPFKGIRISTTNIVQVFDILIRIAEMS
jgi:hypothetical protein